MSKAVGLESHCWVKRMKSPICALIRRFPFYSNKDTSQSGVRWKHIRFFLFPIPLKSACLPASQEVSVGLSGAYNINSKSLSGTAREDTVSCFKELVIYSKRQNINMWKQQGKKLQRKRW